jgi:hypothetical protein
MHQHQSNLIGHYQGLIHRLLAQKIKGAGTTDPGTVLTLGEVPCLFSTNAKHSRFLPVMVLDLVVPHLRSSFPNVGGRQVTAVIQVLPGFAKTVVRMVPDALVSPLLGPHS